MLLDGPGGRVTDEPSETLEDAGGNDDMVDE